MSTRARTRAATAAAAAAAVPSTTNSASQPTPNPPTSAKPTGTSKGKRKTTTPVVQQQQPDPSEKENIKTAPPASTTGPTTATSVSTRSSAAKKQVKTKTNKDTSKIFYCICSRGDDGSPMIRCAECKVWYHFICVDLSEREAEEINVYICSPCSQSTGRRTAMVWEGIDALEDCGSDVETIVPKTETPVTTKTTSNTPATLTQKQKKRLKVEVSIPPAPSKPTPTPKRQSPSDESDGAGSEDDYVDEDEDAKAKGKRRLRLISSDDSSSEIEAPSPSKRRKTKLRKLSRSQTPVSPAISSTTPTSATTPGTATKFSSRLKRKSSIMADEKIPAMTKRKRSETMSGGGGAADDPVRKYCLGKLEEVFRDVFFRYPYVKTSVGITAGAEAEGEDVKMEGEGQVGGIVMKKLEEMTDEENESLTADSKQFAAELEQCVFDIYSEPDKIGSPHASAKYKDRFRMLQFNLSKPDRTVIHQRIVTRTISPKEISLMSSTDLADEETKQHIKIAEKESLEQTILQKSVVPRAKITHKGLQDIEDVNGDLARAREVERQREREEEEEERRERERRERQRAVEKQQQQQRQRTQSLSVPPESPVVPSHSPVVADQSWGAPPPVPAHVLQQHQQGTAVAGDDILNPSIRPLFVHTMSDVVMAAVPEPELNLADLINIDEDGTEQDGTVLTSATTGSGPGGVSDTGTGDSGFDAATPSSVTEPTAPPLDQSIEPDGSVSDKPAGAHHTPVLEGPLMGSPTSPTTPSVVSPFSATRPRGLSFDLNSLWQSAPKEETGDGIATTPKSPSLHQPPPTSILDGDRKDSNSGDGGVLGHTSGISRGVRGLVMEPEPMEVANDDDFDMFLSEEKDEDVVDRSSGSSGPAVPEATPIVQDPEATFEAIPHCWTGKIQMPLDQAAPQSTTVFAKQVGGRSLGYDSLAWKTLFPSQELRIDGRVDIQNSSNFLTQIRMNPTKELIAAAFYPVSEDVKHEFDALNEYFKARKRHGLIFPWGQRQKDSSPGRELYLIPLFKDEALPEYIELLDELKLPKTRKTDLMIGIWILNRGRLSNPPPQPPSTTPVAAPSSATPGAPPSTVPNIPPLPPHLAATASQSPPVPQPPLNAPAPPPSAAPPSAPAIPPHSLPALPPHIDRTALAAEVASLTPEQVSNLLRQISSSNLPFPINLPTPAGGSTGAPQQISPPAMSGQPPHGAHLPLPPPPPPPPPSHPWPGYPVPPGPSPSGGYPSPPSVYGHPPPPPHSHSMPTAPHHGPPSHDRRDSYGPPHGHQGSHGGRGDRDRGERGWRGGGGGGGGGGRDGRHRGGRGKRGGGGNGPNRPVDSGWPRRQRNEEASGSPNRRW
ncbi:Transcription factor bye1 [Leucoagaricus sp. SymC.cos]|nr:Transcription factor bye1 [Leucoagaricus sp. SymC.cos]